MGTFPDSIQSIKGFPRKFKIAEDTPKVAWATITDVEQLGESTSIQIAETQALVSTEVTNIQHSALLNVLENQHHLKAHASNHDGSGSDALELPFEFKKDGTVLVKIDENGNVFIKGRVLKIT